MSGGSTAAELAAYAAVASAAVGAGSGIYSANEQSKATEAQQKAAAEAAAAESIRQANFDRQKMAEVDTALGAANKDNRSEQLDAIEQSRIDLLAPSAVGTEQVAAASPSAPTEVKSDLASAIATASSRANDRAKTLAKIGSYGQSTNNNMRGMNRVGGNIGILDSMSHGSRGVLDTELGMAQYAGQGHLNNASAGQAVGSLASLYANYGQGKTAKTEVPYYLDSARAK